MRQILPFTKDIDFQTSIYEITSISLDDELKLENYDSIVGSFTVAGKYKKNEISINEDEFKYELPIDITLDDKYDASKIKIEIDNFQYEIVDDNILRLHIDVLLDNLVYYKKERCDDIKEDYVEEIALPNEDITKEESIVKTNNESIINDFNLNDNNYVTYKVHIIRGNETVVDIISTYSITKEELEKYNDLSKVVIGDKIIIPYNE